MSRRHRLWDIVVLAMLGLYAVPYAWQVLTSLKPEAELLRLPPLLPTRFTSSTTTSSSPRARSRAPWATAWPSPS